MKKLNKLKIDLKSINIFVKRGLLIPDLVYAIPGIFSMNR